MHLDRWDRVLVDQGDGHGLIPVHRTNWPFRRLGPAHSGGGTLFLIVFGIGFLLGPVRVFWLGPRLGETMATLCEAPFLLIAIVIVARWLPRTLNLTRSVSRQPFPGAAAFLCGISSKLHSSGTVCCKSRLVGFKVWRINKFTTPNVWQALDRWAVQLKAWQRRILFFATRGGTLTSDQIDAVHQLFLADLTCASRRPAAKRA